LGFEGSEKPPFVARAFFPKTSSGWKMNADFDFKKLSAAGVVASVLLVYYFS